MFWLITALLVILASLFVLLPVFFGLRRSQPNDPALRRDANIALYHERLAELELERAGGNLAPEQLEQLKIELQRNLLSDVDSRSLEGPGPAGSSGGDNQQSTARQKPGVQFWSVPSLLVLLVCATAYGLYAHWGYFDEVAYRDLYLRTVQNQDDPDEARELIYALGELVNQDDDRRWARYFLAENLANLGLFTEAERFYQEAADRFEPGGNKALILGRVAMIKYILAEFEITPDVEAAIERVRVINPRESSILQLLAVDAEQRGDWQAAIQNWRLLIQLNPNTEQARQLRLSIAAAQKLLAQDSGAAQGPVIDVAIRLADELQLDPGLRVFVAVRNAEREGMPPLAAVDLTVADLPATISLNDSMAVGGFDISSSDTVYVSALVSMRGSATPAPGDYRVVTDNFAHNGERTEVGLVIESQIP